MKNTKPILKSVVLTIFSLVIMSVFWCQKASAVGSVTHYNHFIIYYYGMEDNDPEVQRLIMALYNEANGVGMTVDDLKLIPLNLRDLPDGFNEGERWFYFVNPNGSSGVGYDNISHISQGEGMYGYFNNPRQAYILEEDLKENGDYITTRVFGSTWKGDVEADDGDGIEGEVEDGVSNLNGNGMGDGNGDGVLDKEQGAVTSLKSNDGVNYVTIANSNNFQQTEVKASNPPADAPSDVRFPYGMFSFQITAANDGDTAHMKIYVPYNSAINGYWKKNIETGEWENIATSITKEGNKTVISFDLKDGGPFDEDGSPDGTINDIGGPGIGQAEVNVESVPTLTWWGLMFMSAMFIVFALINIRRGQKELI